MKTITRRSTVALGSTALLLPGLARAQAAWPTQPVTFVVGYAAGGGADIVARELAHLMTPLLGQQVIVDNKGGAAGAIGARFVSNAKPDGYTLFYAVGTNVVTNPHVLKASIDTLKGLVPIIQTTDYQYVLAVNPSVPVNNVKELIALAKKEPGKLTYSSSGVGGNNHLAGALFAEAAGIELTHAPYKGTGPALMDVISGIITMNFSSLPPAVSQIKAGKLKALAVTGEKRVELAARRADAQGTGRRHRGHRLARPVRAAQDARRHPRPRLQGHGAGDEGSQVHRRAGQGRTGTAAGPQPRRLHQVRRRRARLLGQEAEGAQGRDGVTGCVRPCTTTDRKAACPRSVG